MAILSPVKGGRINGSMKETGWPRVPCIPKLMGFQVFNVDSQKLVLNVYAYDLTLSRPAELHAQFWHNVRSLVKLEPEVFVQGTRMVVES